MASASLSILITAKDAASAPMRAVSGAIDNLVGGLGKIGLAGLGINAVSDALAGLTSGLLSDAIESERIAAATDAVLASTKGAAGMSADAVADLATQLSQIAPFEDEAIQSAENLLLTFTNIGQDIFPTATETVLNMSQALGQDLKSSALQLGKALQDPIAGVTALRRVGVMLTDAQEAQIKALVDAGDLMGAQKVILGELQTEFGGAAVAAGQTFAGQLTILQTQLGNVKEAIGGAVIPALSQLLSAVTPVVTRLATALPDALRALVAAFTTDAGAMGIVMDKIREVLGDDVANAVEPFVNAFMRAIPVIKEFAANAMDWFGRVAGIARQALGGDLGGAIQGVLALVGDVAGKLGPLLAAWSQQFIAWIGPMIPPLLAEAGKLASQLLAWIVEQVPGLIDTLGGWMRAAVNWVADAAVAIVPQLLRFISNVMDWLTANAPMLVQTFLGQWLPAAIGWVAQAAIDILPKLAGLLLTITTWIVTEGVPKLIQFALKMGEGIIAGMGDALGKLGAKLAEWIGDAVRSIHLDFGWIVIDGRSGVSFNIPTPSLPSLGGGTTAEQDAAARRAAWEAAGAPDYNALEAAGVPGFQSGGVVTRPTLALIGEAGPEAVVPLNRIRQTPAGPLVGQLVIQSPEPLSPSSYRRQTERMLRSLALEYGL